MPKSVNSVNEATLKGSKQKPSVNEPPESKQIRVDLANAPILAVHFLEKIFKQNAEILLILKEAKHG